MKYNRQIFPEKLALCLFDLLTVMFQGITFWPWKVTVSRAYKHRANFSGKIRRLYFEICLYSLHIEFLQSCFEVLSITKKPPGWLSWIVLYQSFTILQFYNFFHFSYLPFSLFSNFLKSPINNAMTTSTNEIDIRLH